MVINLISTCSEIYSGSQSALHMLSVRPREQQVAEKHDGEHLCTSSLSSHWSQLGVIYFFKNHFQEQNGFAPENDGKKLMVDVLVSPPPYMLLYFSPPPTSPPLSYMLLYFSPPQTRVCTLLKMMKNTDDPLGNSSFRIESQF